MQKYCLVLRIVHSRKAIKNITTKPNLLDETSTNVYLRQFAAEDFVPINTQSDRPFTSIPDNSVGIRIGQCKLLVKKSPKKLHKHHTGFTYNLTQQVTQF